MNAAATFQRALDKLLNNHVWKACMVYQDDFIISSKSSDPNFKDIANILGILYSTGVSLKQKVCLWPRTEMRSLGQNITIQRLRIMEALAKFLDNRNRPRTLTELHSFFGRCDVYRRFVPSFRAKQPRRINFLKKTNHLTYLHLMMPKHTNLQR